MLESQAAKLQGGEERTMETHINLGVVVVVVVVIKCLSDAAEMSCV